MTDPALAADASAMTGSNPAEAFRVLSRGDVRGALEGIDAVATIEAALRAHAESRTALPAEAYLPWRNSKGAACRSLAMPGGLFDSGPFLGMKIINAAVSNPEAGIPRAGGFTVAFDVETGRPCLLAEGALISALRTACYTMASLRALGPPHFDRVAILGCGNLAQVHLDLIERYFPEVTQLDVHDVRATAAGAIAQSWNRRPGRTATVHEQPRAAVAEAPVLITLTTSDTPYLPAHWLPKEVFVAHVSLDDLAPDALCDAEIFVDDLDLVRDNPRRILGRLLNEGRIDERPGPDRPGLRGTLGQVLTGAIPALRPDGHRIISNPFGMAILDLALLRVVQQAAVEQDLGISVDLTREAPARSVFGSIGEGTP